GRTNLQNLLAAAIAAKAAGLPENAISKGAALLSRVPGRLERVAGDPSLPVFVDFAHTEDALARTISALRELSDRRPTVVFACGAVMLLSPGVRSAGELVAAVERLAGPEAGVLAETGRRIAVLAELPDETENRRAGRSLAGLVDEIVAVGGAGARALLEAAR